MFSWFTDAFTKPFAALTLLDLIKAFIAWCGSPLLLLAIVGGAMGDWERSKEARRAKAARSRQSPERDGESLDDQGRPYE
jgi:hypothetical protein